MPQTRFRLTLLLTCSLALLPMAALTPQSVQAQSSKVQGVMETSDTVTIDWSEGIIQVTGTGSPPDRGSDEQKRLMAERAAVADGYRQLADAINGIRVDAETTVKDYATESDVVRTRVSALIKGAQKVERRFLPGNTIEVDLVVKLYSQDGLSGIVQPQKNRVPPPPVEVKPEAQPGEYTGLIVDCRGLGLKPAMSPAILNKSGGEVYIGNLSVDPEYVVNNGIVAYATSLSTARQNPRAGKNPLIIKGIQVSGNLSSDVVISEADTRLALGLEAQYHILKATNVIFVM